MSRFSELARAAVEAVHRLPGVELVIARAGDDEHATTSLVEGKVERDEHASSAGVGVRVLRNGAWGFAARPGSSEDVAVAAAREAADRAATSTASVRLAAEEPVVGRYATRVDIDPFAVPLDTRVADLELAAAAAREAGGDLAVRAAMSWWRTTMALASSDGSLVEQVLVRGGARVEVGTEGGAAVGGDLAGAGYEHIESLALATEARRVAAEARALVSAPPCPAGAATVVVDAPRLAAALLEQELASESPGPLGRFVFGAPRVNLIADARLPGGAGSFGWDDEGVPARRTPLVSRGVQVGILSSRERAAALGLGRAAGCARAATWSAVPSAQPSNLVLEPDPAGPTSLDELVADTDRGVLLTRGSAWEIVGGKLGQIYRAPSFRAAGPGFWRACDAIGAADAWRLFGVARHQPAVTVGAGAAPARFRGVDLGSALCAAPECV